MNIYQMNPQDWMAAENAEDAKVVRRCVNPDHLRFVTHQENMINPISGRGVARINYLKPRCPNGHEYVPRFWQGKPCRICPTCTQRNKKVIYERNKENARKSVV